MADAVAAPPAPIAGGVDMGSSGQVAAWRCTHCGATGAAVLVGCGRPCCPMQRTLAVAGLGGGA